MDTDMAQKETGKQEILTQGQVKPPFTGPENDGSRPQEDTPGPKQTEQANKWAVLVIVAIGVFMATLDSSIVNISLPALPRSFGVPLSGEIEWVIIAYLVVTAGVLLTAGRISDMIGRKPIWAAGLIIFTVGSAFCGFVSSLWVLIVGCFLIGFRGGLLL